MYILKHVVFCPHHMVRIYVEVRVSICAMIGYGGKIQYAIVVDFLLSVQALFTN
jgi:hypothetical protein